jgi:flagellar M-ring protein FliF
VGALAQIFKSLGPLRLSMIGAVLVGAVLFFVFLITRVTGSNFELLYADLDPSDAGKIVAQLEDQHVPYKIEGNSTRILVPADDVGRLRLSLAAQGLPGGGSVGYEIFDNANSLGTTNFIQNINLVRALEGELARTIRSLDIVQGARVHLVLPQRQAFSRETRKPSASVVLKVRGSGRMPAENVAAIRHLVAAAVPGLEPQNISVIDDKGNLLARGGEGDTKAVEAADMDQRRIAYENRLARDIEDLLQKSVGYGKVRAQVSADMDFSQLTTTEETYDPDGQVVRSTQTVEQQSSSQENEGTQSVSVAANLPDTQGGADNQRTSSNDARTEETVNYEISKKTTAHVREFGEVRRLSVAVLVDGIYDTNADGETVYKPRSQEEMDDLAKLVASTVGFSEERGDTVQVINMRFVGVDEKFEEPLDLFFGLTRNTLIRIAEIVVICILGVLIFLLVIRPLMSPLARALEAVPAAAAAAEQRLIAEQSAATPALTGPSDGPSAEEEVAFEELIDIDRVEGRVRASSVKKVGEIVDKHPEEALSIIRSWMYQET